ncbi:hypothetical protein [Rhodococcus pyridinivorans]|uniref:hypothetical protein n=1 Tax=Rhodococcus pyridinivorans TaxID=103816 RepID=UPI0022838A97|nr:hypothetical protein [Rhodococcus pyridinivorans]WAL48410.1 hypothetical protein OQN32_10255 [Rhodococcus pyridinivorans]
MNRSDTLSSDAYMVSFLSQGIRHKLGVSETHSAALVRAELHATAMAEHYGTLTTVAWEDGLHACYENGHHVLYRVVLVGGGIDDSATA